MSVERKTLEPAYVIHRRAYSDTSMIVELLTPNQGRVSVLARGVKRGKTSKALLLQPFRSLHVSWAGRGELPVLTAAEEAGISLHLQGEGLACGYYINELVYHLVPKFEPAQELFTHYWPTVQSCNNREIRDRHLRYFEIALLEQLGFAPITAQDIQTGRPTVADQWYDYKVPDGPIAAMDDAGKGIRISGDTLLRIAEMNFESAQTQREAKKLTRALINYHLDGKQLMSRHLFKTLSSVGSND